MTTTTATATQTATVTAPGTTDLVRQQKALDRLNKSLEKDSLDDLVAARTKRTLLLIDVSGSMDQRLRTGDRRIDALRKVVTDLRDTHRVPLAAFGLRGGNPVDVVEFVPDPQGSTPLAEAIDFGKLQQATHLVVVTDGEPNCERSAFAAARAFGGAIDVFFVGDSGTRGEEFARELAAMTGGTSGTADLGKPKQLASSIRLLLTDGTEAL
jgi:Mg-chelatase subunit ChlD